MAGITKSSTKLHQLGLAIGWRRITNRWIRVPGQHLGHQHRHRLRTHLAPAHAALQQADQHLLARVVEVALEVAQNASSRNDSPMIERIASPTAPVIDTAAGGPAPAARPGC